MQERGRLMSVPGFNSTEEEIRKWIKSIALICLSAEFQELKNELEQIYRRENVEDPAITAFQDALYSFLVQEEDDRAVNFNAF